MKSILSIHKEILKKEYAKSPLGIIERKLREFYVEMERSKKQLPEEYAKKIFDIRNNNEVAQSKYVEDSLKRDREAVDKMLLEAMEQELEIINNYKSNGE